MSKIKPPKQKEAPPPIPKFVPLKPNPALLNAPVRGEPGATGGPPLNKPDEQKPAVIPPSQPAVKPPAPVVPPNRQESMETESSEEISEEEHKEASAEEVNKD